MNVAIKPSQAAIERDKLEEAAQSLKRLLEVRGLHPGDFSIQLGIGELHAYAPCHEVQLGFKMPCKVDGTPVEWHFGNVGMVSAREAAE